MHAGLNDAIKVSNLIKRYKGADSNAVDDVSFSVGKGEFFALLGPNGAGKTTTVSILTTTLAKTGGNVQICGLNLDSEETAIRRQVGVIFQGPSTDLNLSAEENIRFHAMLYGIYPFRPSYSMMPRQYKDRIQELAKMLDIEKVLFKPMRTYSGGMKRKLEIVRSLVHKPNVIFLDEPTTGLDPLSRRSLWEYLRKVQKEEGTTIFLTTHYLEEAEAADHVAIMGAGKIVMYGTPREIKSRLVRDELIVDSNNRAVLRAELSKFSDKISENGPFRIALDGGAVRAQDIISGIKSSLTVLDIERPSLEDAYLAIIEGGKSEGD
jgi:ABC-2 type transport system ATP-binding protein